MKEVCIHCCKLYLKYIKQKSKQNSIVIYFTTYVKRAENM